MPSSDDHSRLQNLGTVMGVPEGGLRYMRRRRVGTADRNGDPLDGIVNLWDLAIVLAVGFLVAALAAVGVTGLLTHENMTIVTDPGTPDMQVIVKEGDTITKLDMQSGQRVSGAGTLLGSFSKLADAGSDPHTRHRRRALSPAPAGVCGPFRVDRREGPRDRATLASAQ
jgi:hypothetical protein